MSLKTAASAKVKNSICLLLFCIALFTVIIMVKYPKTVNDLENIKINDVITTEEGDLVVKDVIQTDGQTSWFYLLQRNNNSYILIAKKFPFVKKYEMSRLMSYSSEGIFNVSDYYNDIIVTCDENGLSLTEEKNVSMSVHALAVIFLTRVIHIVCAFGEQKKYSGK